MATLVAQRQEDRLSSVPPTQAGLRPRFPNLPEMPEVQNNAPLRLRCWLRNSKEETQARGSIHTGACG